MTEEEAMWDEFGGVDSSEPTLEIPYSKLPRDIRKILPERTVSSVVQYQACDGQLAMRFKVYLKNGNSAWCRHNRYKGWRIL